MLISELGIFDTYKNFKNALKLYFMKQMKQ